MIKISVGFCMKCRQKQEMVNETMQEKMTSRGMKKWIAGECKVCGTKVRVMVGR